MTEKAEQPVPNDPIPGSEWRVNDDARPKPETVTPGNITTLPPPTPPSDATVLFDGSHMEEWKSARDGGPCPWVLENGIMRVEPKTGNIVSKKEFGDCQLHIEFSAPAEIKGEGQGRGNSGVFLMNQYEVQVLDNCENPTYADGYCGSMYGQSPTLVNACAKPGEWNVYDIIWTAPAFDGDMVTKQAACTVLHNGIVVQNHTIMLGRTTHKRWIGYAPHGPAGPIGLQDHGDRVSYRNIWVREL